MSKARIFILAWSFVLLVTAISFYVYVAVLGKPKIGKLNLFAPEKSADVSVGRVTDGWLGILTGDRDLYPAKEVDFHVELGESEKNYIITVDSLSQKSLELLEQNLKNFAIAYRVIKEPNGFKVEVDSPNRSKMQARLEIIKTFNLNSKN